MFETIYETALYGPVVNLNGADRQSLIKDHRAVRDAAAELYRAMSRAAPHGRDYQTAAAGAFSRDQAVFTELLKRVDNIERQYNRILERLSLEDPQWGKP